MRHSAALEQHQHLCSNCAVLLAVLLFLTSICTAQGAPSGQSAKNPGLEFLNQYPGLLPEFGRLTDKLQHDVEFPPERNRSDLLPLLPASTTAYMAFPNYGDAAHQALTIFQQELRDSPDLRAWWSSSEMITTGPKIEDALVRFSEVSKYLGDEIVVSAVLEGRDPDLLVLARVRQPGLKAVLQKTVLALPESSRPGLRILDPQELATEKAIHPEGLLVLVRPDFVVASTNLAALRTFNDRLTSGARDFVSNPFAQRILQSYAGGVSVIGAIDLQKLLTRMPHDPGFATFQRTGFADVKYAVWEHRTINGRALSQTEVSFTGPRQGIASWLAAPVPLGSLDFVSPKAIFAGSFVLNNPPQMLDDIRELSASNPNALASVTQMEQALGVSLKDDILSQLGGEVTIELDSIVPADQPVWKAIVRVKDANRFQQTLSTMLSGAHLPTEQYEQAGVTYHLIRTPSAKGTSTIGFAFVDGYLIFASSPDTLAEAIRLHQSGESLSKSRPFQASLPAGHSGASALMYYDQAEMLSMQFQKLFGDVADSISQFAAKRNPMVVCVYGENDSIREASTSPGTDVGAIVIGAAIGIPNLLRSRMAANEASAVGKIRTVNVAQITYATTYPERGFAPDLATLGPDPNGAARYSADHAGLLDATFADPTCTARNWCTSSGYRFLMKASCGLGSCRDFVSVATPVTSNSGSRTFCSTADGVIRYQIAPPLTTPPALKECKAWKPLK